MVPEYIWLALDVWKVLFLTSCAQGCLKVAVLHLKGMFCKGLLDGPGAFTRADGFKYEVLWDVVLSFSVVWSRAVDLPRAFLNVCRVQWTGCEFDPTGRLCEPLAHGPGHLHLAWWQHLRGAGVSLLASRDGNLHVFKERCGVHGAMEFWRETRKGTIRYFASDIDFSRPFSSLVCFQIRVSRIITRKRPLGTRETGWGTGKKAGG